MAWVRLDDKFPEHDKVVAVGGDAAWLHVCALAYCNRNETDGHIPTGILGRLSDRRQPTRLAAALVGVGLWEPSEGGWVIHDYLEYQPSRAQRDEERSKARERMTNNRRSSPNVRPNNPRTSSEQSPKFARSSPYPEPAPGPVPVVLTSEHAAAAVPMSSAAAAAVEIFVEHRVAKARPDSPKRFADTVRAREIATHAEQLSVVNGEADPVQVACNVFDMTLDQAIVADHQRRLRQA